jgi:hypothetical protein
MNCPSCGQAIVVRAAQGFVMASLVTIEQAAMLDMLTKSKMMSGHAQLVEVVRAVWPDGISAAVTRWVLALPDPVARDFCYTVALGLNQAGVPHEDVLRRHHEIDIRQMAASEVVSSVEILSSGGCEECATIHGRKIPIEEAVRSSPLPHPGCTYDAFGERGFCRCTLIAGAFK